MAIRALAILVFYIIGVLIAYYFDVQESIERTLSPIVGHRKCI